MTVQEDIATVRAAIGAEPYAVFVEDVLAALARLEADLDRKTEALLMLATYEGPCRKCGKPHHPIEQPSHTKLAPQWGDPVDGHAYEPMNANDFARAALAGDGR